MPVMGPPAAVGKRSAAESAVSEPSANEGAPPKRVRFEEGVPPTVENDEEEDKKVNNRDGDDDDEDNEDNEDNEGNEGNEGNEDNEDKPEYEILADDDVEGQEEGTLKVDDGVRITPFNIQEELEEGHFDKDGNFYVDKNKEINDAWLDGLDQFADEDFEKLRKKKAEEREKEDAATPAGLTDTELYKVVLTIVQPGESVGKALRRLGSAIKPTKRVKKTEKSDIFGKTEKTEKNEKIEKTEKNEKIEKSEKTESEVFLDPVKKLFDSLTSAADTLLQKGNLEIYQETFEKIQHRLKKAESRLSALKVDDEADIFGNDFNAAKIAEATSNSASGSQDDDDNSGQTMWEYKWQNTDTSTIHGPYSSEQMTDWVQQEFFKDGVFVRKVGVAFDAPFYSSKRVDFELYV